MIRCCNGIWMGSGQRVDALGKAVAAGEALIIAAGGVGQETVHLLIEWKPEGLEHLFEPAHQRLRTEMLLDETPAVLGKGPTLLFRTLPERQHLSSQSIGRVRHQHRRAGPGGISDALSSDRGGHHRQTMGQGAEHLPLHAGPFLQRGDADVHALHQG